MGDNSPFSYHTEIEDAFVRRRGTLLLLSPKDWTLIECWKSMGIPLQVVLRGIERVFDSNEMRANPSKINSLAYCQHEVEAQFREWRRKSSEES